MNKGRHDVVLETMVVWLPIVFVVVTGLRCLVNPRDSVCVFPLVREVFPFLCGGW